LRCRGRIASSAARAPPSPTRSMSPPLPSLPNWKPVSDGVSLGDINVAAAATLVTASETRSLSGFQFGSDGSGGDMLLVGDGGARVADDAIKPRHRKRWKSRLYMDGPSLISFTVEAIPRLVDEILAANQLSDADIGKYLMHQATWKMLDQLRNRMDVSEDRLPIELAEVGNTVSCTLPILIDQLRNQGKIDAKSVNMLLGFGVGLSWAGCLWRDQWAS
jgi:3-oxoacyl-[acyl-carrier-protein] synthase-3